MNAPVHTFHAFPKPSVVCRAVDHASSLPHRKQKKTVCAFLKTIHAHSLAQRDVHDPPSQRNTHTHFMLVFHSLHLCVVSVSTHSLYQLLPFVSLSLALASISIFRCYCEAALRSGGVWVCLFSKVPLGRCKSVTFQLPDWAKVCLSLGYSSADHSEDTRNPRQSFNYTTDRHAMI